MKRALLSLYVTALAAGAASGQGSDPMGQNLFPPELIMQHRGEIGLTEEQREWIEGEIHKAQDGFGKMRGEMEKETDALGTLLAAEKVDEKAALAQFDSIQARERDIRRKHLSLLVGLKNKLNVEQQTRLKELKKTGSTNGKRLEGKMQKVKAGVEGWQSAGRDPSRVAETMQEFEPLMKEGKFQAAEAVLDRALKILAEP